MKAVKLVIFFYLILNSFACVRVERNPLSLNSPSGITTFLLTFYGVEYTVGGTVSGLATAGLVLQNNGGDDLTVISGATSFTFATPVADGAGYNVTVLMQPAGQTCSASNNTGTIAGANVTNVTVTCSVNSYTVGGTVSGLATAGLVLQNNGGDDLTVISGATSFTFATPVADGGGYNVTILAQPTGQTCSAAPSTGTINGAGVTNVAVVCHCSPCKMFITTATSQGNVGGISGADNFCLTDTAYPGTGTYKAFIVDGINRRACTTANCTGGVSENINWVLHANTAYARLTGVAISTTNSAGIFAFPLTNRTDTTGNTYWTGLNQDWTPSAANCSSWTANANLQTGETGTWSSTTATSISTGGVPGACDLWGSGFLCVEQ